MNKTKKLLSAIIVVPILLLLGLAGCVSDTELSIEISSPLDGAIVSESPVTVTGTVTGYPRGEINVGGQTASAHPEVTVNGNRATVDEDGNFSAQVELSEGENAIEAIAMFNNVEDSTTITVTYTPSVVPPLAVVITSPEDGTELTESPATITGNVSSAEAALTVNGGTVEVNEDGTFSTDIELTEGENTIEALAILGEEEASNGITVTYAPPVVIPLSVIITSPEDGAELSEGSVSVTGNVSDTGATLSVNGEAVAVNADGIFSTEVQLNEGENLIMAAAMLGEEQASDSITVIYIPELQTGMVKLYIAGSGNETNVTSILITASEVEVHQAEGNEQNGEWVTLDISSPTFDLIELRDGGLEEILASGNITPGKYTQVRVLIEKVEVSIGGGALQVVEVPSNELKFVKPFEIIEGETSVLTLDFDTAKTVSFTINFKPVVKLSGPPEPALSVAITSPENGAELTESLITVNGTVSDPDATVSINGEVVTVNEDGVFSIEIEIIEGENIIEALAKLEEEEASASIIVTYSPELALTSIAVEPASPDDLEVGSTQQFTATGTYSDNSTTNITSLVTWTSSDPEVASIDVTGLATGVTEGTCKITASLTGVTSPEITLTVVAAAPALTSIAIEPASPDDLEVGSTQQFTATGTYSDNSTANITSLVTWTSSNPEVASIDVAGLATGVAEGTSNITASLSEVASPEITVSVVTP